MSWSIKLRGDPRRSAVALPLEAARTEPGPGKVRPRPEGVGCAVGVALSGGAARCVAHIGALKALTEGGIGIDALTATSGGAVIGVLFAAGLSIEDIERAAISLRWRDLARLQLGRLGLISIRPLQNLLESLIGPVRLEELPIPMTIVATNLVRRQKHFFRSGDAIRAVLASAAMPHIYRPIDIDGELFADGGIVEYLPLSALEAYRPLVRIGVHLLSEEEVPNRPRHFGQVVLSIVNIIQRENSVLSLREADVLIKPDVGVFPPFDLVNARALIAAGHEAASRQVPKIRELLEERRRWLGELGPEPPGEPPDPADRE